MHDTDDEDVNATPVMHDHVIAELLTDYVRNRCGPHIDVHRFEHVVMVEYTIGRYELFVLDGCVKVQVSALRAPYRTFDEMIWRAKLEFADPAFFGMLDLLLADIAPQIPLCNTRP